jgi:hypothetical protein
LTFCPKGWVSIKGLHEHFASTITFWWDYPTFQEQHEGEADKRGLYTAWECLESMEAVSILGPNGQIIPVACSTVANRGYIEQKSNFDINLEYGTLGSGHGGFFNKGGATDAPMDASVAKLHYGPFAYCPVLIPKASFDAFDCKNDSEIREENGYDRGQTEIGSVVQQIFETIDSGRAVKRDDIKRIVAKEMKVDVWRAHWREAVISRPELGKSGPKSKRC